jgi:hypothetical protein
MGDSGLSIFMGAKFIFYKGPPDKPYKQARWYLKKERKRSEKFFM